MALPSLSQVISALADSFTSTGAKFAVASTTFTTTTAVVAYNVSGGIFGSSSGTSTYFKGVDFGVPGPELAGGLPFLAVAVAFAGYRYYRGGHAQKVLQ